MCSRTPKCLLSPRLPTLFQPSVPIIFKVLILFLLLSMPFPGSASSQSVAMEARLPRPKARVLHSHPSHCSTSFAMFCLVIMLRVRAFLYSIRIYPQ
ncbi:hypothetical protein FB451DRAFT_1215911 [Mycena latifolia]|nr:hypothetical protein FB451DRAFT_1215911 [Mycena latifolia]